MASGLCLLKSTFPLGKNPMSKPFLYLVSPTVLFYRVRYFFKMYRFNIFPDNYFILLIIVLEYDYPEA